MPTSIADDSSVTDQSDGPAGAGPPDAERADLLDALAKRRFFLRVTVRDLTDEQAALRPTASALCLGGLIKHVSAVERHWADFIVNGPARSGPPDEAAMAAHAATFTIEQGERLQSLLDAYEQVAARTDELLRNLPSLDASQPLPEAPWFAPGARWTARQTLLHVIGETAQHAGHADILRESIDGQKTMG